MAAAADLAPLQTPLSNAFRKFEPNAAVRFVISSSGALNQQIQSGAPYDVFLSADARFVDELASNGKVLPDSVIVYAIGRLGMLWKDGNQHPLSDLTAEWVRFAAVPNGKLAPYGRAAQQALEHEHLWTKLQSKLVIGENVRQTLQFFDSGNADAVLTADSLLQGRNPQLIPSEWHQPIQQKGGIVASSTQIKTARRFLDFLRTPAGQAVFLKFGFSSPP